MKRPICLQVLFITVSLAPMTLISPVVAFAQVNETAVKPGSETTAVSNQSIAVLPFDFEDNQIMVAVHVNDGAEPFHFAVDSGSSVSVISTDTANHMKMRLRDPPVFSILGMKVRVPLKAKGYGEKGYALKSVERVRLRVASDAVDFPVSQSTYIVTSLPKRRSGQPIDGILGYDFLSKYVVAIDYLNHTLTLYNRKSYQYAGHGQNIPLQVTSEQVFVRAVITPLVGDSLPAKMLLDTGNSSGLILNTAFINKQKLLDTTTSFPFTKAGPAGNISGRTGRLGSLAIGSYSIARPSASFLQSSGGEAGTKDHDGGVGNDILCRFNVVLDFTGRHLFLEPNADFAKPSAPVIYSGLNSTVVPDGFHITSVDAGSPASIAGFLAGDTLLAVDNVYIAGVPSKTYASRFKDEAPHHYLVRRDTKEITLSMQSIAF